MDKGRKFTAALACGLRAGKRVPFPPWPDRPSAGARPSARLSRKASTDRGSAGTLNFPAQAAGTAKQSRQNNDFRDENPSCKVPLRCF